MLVLYSFVEVGWCSDCAVFIFGCFDYCIFVVVVECCVGCCYCLLLCLCLGVGGIRL